MFNRLTFDDMHGFSGWLQAAGAEVLPPTNPWEILRVRTSEGTLVAYKNAKGRQSWPPRLDALRRAYLANQDAPALSPRQIALEGAMVTIFADASFDERTMAAGWACWVKTNSAPSAISSGVITSPVRSSQEAELWALANALAFAHRQNALKPGALVLLQSDCIPALTRIVMQIPGTVDRPFNGGLIVPRKTKAAVTKAECAALVVIAETVLATGISLLTRHVRAHQENHDGRQWVNNECDRLAKLAMREWRQEIEGNTNV